MDFGDALRAMKQGKRVAREEWRNAFIVFMEPLYLPPFSTQDTARKVNDRTAKWVGEDSPLDCQPYIAMFTENKQWQPGWVANQSDILSEDWKILA